MTTKLKENGKELQGISLPQMEMGILKCAIVGTSPLIVNNPAYMMEPAQKIGAGGGSDEETEFRNSLYMTPSGHYGLPWTHIHKAIAAVSTDIKKKGKVFRKHFEAGIKPVPSDGDYFILEGEPTMDRRQVVIRATKARITRTRARFDKWRIVLLFQFNRNFLNEDLMITAIQLAGNMNGLGDFTPRKGGIYGTFEIEEDSIKVSG